MMSPTTLARGDVTAMMHVPTGLEVDEHSVTVARYEHGLSKFETRWGTFSDPWTNQPQPKCGFAATPPGTLFIVVIVNFSTP